MYNVGLYDGYAICRIVCHVLFGQHRGLSAPLEGHMRSRFAISVCLVVPYASETQTITLRGYMHR